MGFIFCFACEKRINIKDSSEVEKYRLGTYLICLSCDRRITAAVIDRVIDDTSVPKTYRKIFKQYIKWMEEKE